MCSLLLLAIMGLPFLAGAQSATVHIYRTGNPRGKLHVKMDGHDLFLLQDGHAATLAVQPGDHEFWVGFEGIGSGSTPVAVSIVHARQGSEAFLHVDYQFAFGKAMMGGGATSMHLAMQEEPGMPPDLKEQRLDAKELEAAASSRRIESRPKAEQASLPVASLTDSQVDSAILQGLHDPSPNGIGLYLNDVQTAIGSGLADNGASATNGFSVIVYSAFHWIEYQAALAHHQMRPFTARDVTPEMRADVVRVVALPNTPANLNGRGIAASSGVARVVICDMSKTVTVQPLSEQASTVTSDSALRSKDYTSMASSFNRAEVEALRSKDKRGEFYVVVIGESGERKFFNLKQKYSSWL
jgi:hypothetical protein